MKELHSESEDQDLEFTQDVTGSHIPDTEEVPVDTAKIQAALEKRADQETAILPRLTLPDTEGPDASAENPVSGKTLQDEAAGESGKPARKKRRTSRSLRERWWTPSVRSWFYTFMCMNMPIVGWFYLLQTRIFNCGSRRPADPDLDRTWTVRPAPGLHGNAVENSNIFTAQIPLCDSAPVPAAKCYPARQWPESLRFLQSPWHTGSGL